MYLLEIQKIGHYLLPMMGLIGLPLIKGLLFHSPNENKLKILISQIPTLIKCINLISPKTMELILYSFQR